MDDAQPLSSFTVVETSDEVAARYCGWLFAALGARVVRTSRTDDRHIGYAGACGTAYGRWLDAGKVFLDPGEAAAQARDLVIAGQDAEAVEPAAAFAGTGTAPVLLALTWFDLEGPYGDWRGSDEVIAAMSGVAYSFGEAAGPPMLAQGHAPSITAGAVAFNAALGALLSAPGRRPRRVDVNVLEAAICFCEAGALTGRLNPPGSVRLGVNRFVPTYPCAPYRTADGWVGVTCLTPAQWKSLCGLLGRQDLAADPRLATTYERLMLSEEVDAALTPAFARRTTEEWVALAIAHRIPITPMARPGKIPEVAHWRDWGAFAPFGEGEAKGPTLPYRMRFDGVASAPWAPRGLVADEQGPLAGLRVIDFSMGWAGPLCARTLADLGADVIKVESKAHPDWWRGWEVGPEAEAAREIHHNFIDQNRNKRGVDIDLASPAGLAQAKALVAGADVVIENYAAGVMDRLGLGQDVQRALRPGVISLSMPAFGNGGPLSEIRAYGSTVEQASGMPFVNGEADWPPAQQHVAFGDPVAGLFSAGAVLAALAGRKRLGGADIDLAQVACLFQLGADGIIAEQVLGSPAPRTGHRRARLALCAVVRTRGEDAWLAVAAADEHDLARLDAVTGGAGEAALCFWAASRTAEDAARGLQAAGVCAGPVARPDGLCSDRQLTGSGYWVEMQRQFVGAHLVAASPFRFDGLRPALLRPAPILGEHTEEVLRELA
jgi:crotonobetainyl-CoA:carnitine CoA-transferase CaiB-like acyl-CoA transferase